MADKWSGAKASSAEFAKYDLVDKPHYQLAESSDDAGAIDEDFEIAVCDLGLYLSGKAADKAQFVSQLGAAMSEIGFAILINHGIDPALYETAEAWITELFTTVSLEDKMKFRATRHGSVSEGYFPIHETSDIHPDLVEGWVFGRRAFHLGDEECDAAELWPKPELEPLFRRLVEAGTALFQPIMAAIIEYLGADPDSYVDRLTKPNFGQRLNYYPAMNADHEAAGAGRLLGHEDIDLFTLLPAPTVEGLQALNRAGKWVRVKAPLGSIVLNTGDYLQRISNDVLPSTTHRVSPPRNPADAERTRVSFPLAAYLRPDELLEVLPCFETPKYDPIRVITFHTSSTAKFYGDDYAVESPV